MHQAARSFLCIAELSFPEQLVLWSVRKWLEDRGNWGVIQREMCRACGAPTGQVVLLSLDAMLTLLTQNARRSIHFHPLAQREVSADEQAVLGLIAASQACDRYHAEAQARAFVAAAAARPLLESAAVVGAALESANRALPPRYALPSPGDAIH